MKRAVVALLCLALLLLVCVVSVQSSAYAYNKIGEVMTSFCLGY